MNKTTIPEDVEEMLNNLAEATGNSADELLREAVMTLVARRKLRQIESIGCVSLPNVRADQTEDILDNHWAKSLEWR